MADSPSNELLRLRANATARRKFLQTRDGPHLCMCERDSQISQDPWSLLAPDRASWRNMASKRSREGLGQVRLVQRLALRSIKHSPSEITGAMGLGRVRLHS